MAKKRRDINELNSSDLGDYIHALNILQERSRQDPDDETGYDFQAGLHNDVFIGPCEHGNDLFLAWHRAHLHYFEELLQGADPPRTANMTIPYWDWLHPEAVGKFPRAFAEPGLFTAGRNNNPSPLPPDTLEIVTTETDWNAFGGFPKGDPAGDYGRLELGPHNTMHPFFIGGKMENPATAAEDAIYWSFHGFIDLLWAEWQRRNGMPPPTSPAADLRGFSAKPQHKVRDFQLTTGLDYEYEYTARLQGAFAVGQPVRRLRELITARSMQPLFAEGLGAELQRASRAQFALPSLPPAATNAFVRLQALRVPITGNYMLQAYAHPRDIPFNSDDPGFRERFGVGYATLWRAHATDHGHGGHERAGGHPPQPHHPTSCVVRFDVSRRLEDVGLEAFSDLVLTLLYIPAPGPTGEPQPAPDLVINEVQLQDVVLEAYTQP